MALRAEDYPSMSVVSAAELKELRAMKERAREMYESWSATEPNAQAAGVASWIFLGDTDEQA